ncbi:MAG: hypothetical protein K0Q89_2679 [Thermomicrobiales bacterium]|nr:hypothetical protein [Thermomicrobiales bacterium]
MTVPDTTPHHSDAHRETLEQQVRALQERLAFYEGFDRLIQDNVGHARELFRLAAREREAASTAIARTRHDAGQREAQLRGELEQIASDLEQLAHTVETLSARVARALGEAASNNGGTNSAPATEARIEQPVTVVVHGVPSAREALSLQRFVASLPQVADVSAREFVGGVLRLDARVRDQLAVAQFLTWDDARRVEALTERPDLLELALTEVTGSQGVRVTGER